MTPCTYICLQFSGILHTCISLHTCSKITIQNAYYQIYVYMVLLIFRTRSKDTFHISIGSLSSANRNRFHNYLKSSEQTVIIKHLRFQFGHFWSFSISQTRCCRGAIMCKLVQLQFFIYNRSLIGFITVTS